MLEPMVVQSEGYERRVKRLLGAMTADLLSRVQQDSGEHDRCVTIVLGWDAPPASVLICSACVTPECLNCHMLLVCFMPAIMYRNIAGRLLASCCPSGCSEVAVAGPITV